MQSTYLFHLLSLLLTFYILLIKQVPGVGLLQSPKLPDTLLFQSPTPEISFSAEGLVFTPVQTMHTWKVHYHGIMK